MKPVRRFLSAQILPFTLAAVLAACAGSVPPPDTEAPASERPAGVNTDPNAPEVEIYAGAQRLVIDEFRIDFAEIRNVYALIGFHPDQWQNMDRIPLKTIHEIEFRGVVDDGTFEQIYKNREQLQLNQQEIFRVYVRLQNGNAFDYFAFIPRIRGFKDGQRWEQPMAGNSIGIDRIVIRSAP